jgi:Protein of unknown function (DUF3181)
MSITSENIESLAAAIAEEVYIDIAKWHLYLGDAHLHTVLAEQFYPMLTAGVNASTVTQVLGSTMVKIGGGKRELPLSDFIPDRAQANLLNVLENFSKDL